MSEELIGAAALTSRYVVGLVFLTAALPKLFARRQFRQAVSNYHDWLRELSVLGGHRLD